MALAISTAVFILLVAAICLAYKRWSRTDLLHRHLRTASSAPKIDPDSARPRFYAVLRLAEVIGQRVPPSATSASSMQRNLLACGFRAQNAVAVFYGLKLILMSAIPVAMFVFNLRSRMSPAMQLAGVAIGALSGFRIPDFVLARHIKHRQSKIRRALPDALELMIVCAEAGMSIDRSFRTITEQLAIAHPGLAEEFSLVTCEINAGLRRREALENLAARTQEPETKKFVAVLTQADRFGTSVADAMRTHADYLRIKRRQEAEERAGQVGVKLTFPIFLFILPCMFLVTAGPAVLQIAKQLGPALMGKPL